MDHPILLCFKLIQNFRSDFNKIWDKLINNLSVGKKFMLDLIEQATIAYDQREEWVSKLQILRQKAHNDLLAHIQEMRILQRKRDNDGKLQEFFAVKGQKRIMKDLEEAEKRKRQQAKDNMEKKLDRYLNMLITIMVSLKNNFNLFFTSGMKEIFALSTLI